MNRDDERAWWSAEELRARAAVEQGPGYYSSAPAPKAFDKFGRPRTGIWNTWPVNQTGRLA